VKVIVDAYNVLHAMVKTDRVNENERKHFIRLLAAYAKRKKNKVIVVFDAGPFLFPSTEQQKGITIKYSGPNDSADDIILRYIKNHQGQSMMLASSDRELCAAAQYYAVESVTAQDFHALLVEHQMDKMSPKKTGQAIKISSDSDEMVDALMHQTRVPIKNDDMQSPVDQRKPASQKASKKERKRMQKLKKL
jgi:predicted RNA-binding protein with PIN domain